MQRARLRFDPLGCVVTIVSGEAAEAQVLDVVGPGSEVVCLHGGEGEHFSEIHGSVIYVGAEPSWARRAVAAAVLDLPSGRTTAKGTAIVTDAGGGDLQATCVLQTVSGLDVRLRLRCRDLAASLEMAELIA